MSYHTTRTASVFIIFSKANFYPSYVKKCKYPQKKTKKRIEIYLSIDVKKQKYGSEQKTS